MFAEFRDFIDKGNFVDIAVAFVMGAAFGAVITALTERIVSPLIGMIVTLPSMESIGRFGPVDPATGVPAGSLGAFLEAFLNFLVIALVMFFVVKAYNRLRKPAESGAPPEDVVLLRDIRDELRNTRR